MEAKRKLKHFSKYQMNRTRRLKQHIKGTNIANKKNQTKPWGA